MKSLIIPFLCAVALATMAAAGVQHWLTVQAQLASPIPSQPAPAAQLPQANLPKPTPTDSATHPNATLPTPNPSQASQTVQPTPELVARLDQLIATQQKILTHLSQLDQQQAQLRDQLAETNRDLMDLQFRVDSHSESFRPLRATQDNPIATPQKNPLLPPRQSTPDPSDQ